MAPISAASCQRSRGRAGDCSFKPVARARELGSARHRPHDQADADEDGGFDGGLPQLFVGAVQGRTHSSSIRGRHDHAPHLRHCASSARILCRSNLVQQRLRDVPDLVELEYAKFLGRCNVAEPPQCGLQGIRGTQCRVRPYSKMLR